MDVRFDRCAADFVSTSIAKLDSEYDCACGGFVVSSSSHASALVRCEVLAAPSPNWEPLVLYFRFPRFIVIWWVASRMRLFSNLKDLCCCSDVVN